MCHLCDIDLHCKRLQPGYAIIFFFSNIGGNDMARRHSLTQFFSASPPAVLNVQYYVQFQLGHRQRAPCHAYLAFLFFGANPGVGRVVPKPVSS
jgi:hypothetical protein